MKNKYENRRALAIAYIDFARTWVERWQADIAIDVAYMLTDSMPFFSIIRENGTWTSYDINHAYEIATANCNHWAIVKVNPKAKTMELIDVGGWNFDDVEISFKSC